MKRKILITGSSGYLGSAIAKELRKGSHELYLLQRDETSQLGRLFAENAFTDVIHLAAAGADPTKGESTEAILNANIGLPLKILEAMASSQQCKNFICAGSFWQDGDQREPAHRHSINFYAATKRAFEDFVGVFTAQFGLRCLELRLFDVYGPYDHRPKIFNLLASSIKENSELGVSLGEQKLSFVFLDDVVRGFCVGLDALGDLPLGAFLKYDLRSEKLISLKDAIEVFSRVSEELLKVKPRVKLGAKPYATNQIFNPRLFSTLPGWEPQIDLESGLRQLLQSFNS